MKNRHILICAGEASGDMHGAHVVRAMQQQAAGLFFAGIGGQELAAAGVEILFDAARLAVVGLTEVLSHLPDILAARRVMLQRMREGKPDLLILIDYPDFNLLLAAQAKKMGIPVLYYISPQVWAWRSGRVDKIGRLSDRRAVILPFEKDFYAQRGVEVDFVGHPLVDQVHRSQQSRATFFEQHKLTVNPETRVIGLLPGSRSKEIQSLLPDFLAAAEILVRQRPEQDWLFVLPLASTVSEDFLLRTGLAHAQEQGLPLRVFTGQRYDLMAACDAALAASGTVTLELAMLAVPTVATYRLSPRTYFFARLLVRHLRHFSLVNLIARREVIPELLQKEVSPQSLAKQLFRILEDPEYHRSILNGLAEVTAQLGPPGCADRTAALAFSCMRNSFASHLMLS
jgi:lipid-A-disaccharide synthase